jgi:tetratricopeptide (TPR) repeat protein
MPKKMPEKEKAIKQFETAVKLVNSKNYTEAEEMLKKIIEDSPHVGDVVQRAGDYLNICESQRTRSQSAPKDSESKYLYSIFYLNNGDFKEAEKYLISAAGKTWQSKHLYLMALIQFAKEDIESGLDYLKKAIKKNPKNRILAYNNPELFPLHKNPEFKKIVSKV